MKNPLSGIDKAIRPWLGISFALLLAVVAVALSFIAYVRAERQQSECRFYYGVGLASGPTIPATTTSVGLSILVGARAAYAGLHCDLGSLPVPAPAVARLLPPGVK